MGSARAWLEVYDRPVYPEPPFASQIFRSMVDTPAVDDGRKPTLLSSLVRKLSQTLASPAVVPVRNEAEEEPQPVFLNRGSLVELQVSLPADFDFARDSFDQFFRNLALCREPVAFELIGSYRRVLV